MHSDVSWWNVCCTKLMATCNIKLHSVSFRMKKKFTPQKIPAICVPVCHFMSSHRSPHYRRYNWSAHYQSLTSTPHSLLLSTTSHLPSICRMMTYASCGGNTCMRSNKHKHQKIIAAGLTGGGGGGKEMLIVVCDYVYMLVLAYNNANENPSLFAAL